MNWHVKFDTLVRHFPAMSWGELLAVLPWWVERHGPVQWVIKD